MTVRLVTDGKTTADCLAQSGKNIRKYRLRTAVNEGRARKEIALAREEGMNDTEIRRALGFSVADYKQLIGNA